MARRRYPPKLKAQVVLEVLAGDSAGDHDSVPRGRKMKRIIMISIVTLATLPETADAQDLTACFSVELLDHQEDEEVVLQAYGFRNNCAEWTHVDWYQRSVDPVTQAPGLISYGVMNVLPGEAAHARVAWRKEHGPFPPPVLAWCGWRGR